MIYSMTGFASRGFSFQGQSFRIEIKSLNHRFLELKLRIPRELNALESLLRPLVEKKLKRGSVELWIERQNAGASASEWQLNLPQATQAFMVLSQLREQFKVSDPLSLRDLSSFPEVITKAEGVKLTEAQWGDFEKQVVHEVQGAIDDLLVMRGVEGGKLKEALLLITQQFKQAHDRLMSQREIIRGRAREKIKKRIELCFEAYPTPDAKLRAVMESRISQEIAIALDKLDVEEELTRYSGHIEQIEKLLNGKEAVGKKLDFLLQELNREVNTLGNKSQDLEMSQEVMQLKMWVEQLREQCMNLE